jgi:hypothetical protein
MVARVSYHKTMDVFRKLFGLLFAAALSMGAADLSGVKFIYLLPMSGGLDQHLAIRLARGSWVQVVTDAQKADAVLTDAIGEGFERRLAEINGQAAKKTNTGKAGDEEFSHPSMRPLSHNRGNIFLVDRKTGNVIWTTAERPKDSSTASMTKAADKIAAQLEKDYKGK